MQIHDDASLKWNCRHARRQSQVAELDAHLHALKSDALQLRRCITCEGGAGCKNARRVATRRCLPLFHATLATPCHATLASSYVKCARLKTTLVVPRLLLLKSADISPKPLNSHRPISSIAGISTIHVFGKMLQRKRFYEANIVTAWKI